MSLFVKDPVNQLGIRIFHDFDQFWYLFGRALQVIIKRDDLVSFCEIKSAEGGIMLPEILSQPDRGKNIRIFRLDFFQDFPAPVLAAIIHENELKGFPGIIHDCRNPAEQLLQGSFAVINRYNYRKFNFLHGDDFMQM